MSQAKTKLATRWLDVLSLLVATGLIVSPFVLEFEASAVAIRNQVMLGVLFGIFAVWSIGNEIRCPQHDKVS